MVRYLKATSDELRSPERAKYGWAIHRQPRVGLSAAINYARKRWETWRPQSAYWTVYDLVTPW